MKKFYEILSQEAQEDLLHNSWIDLVQVIVEAVPDPEQPEDRLAMKINADVYDDFRQDIPWIDEELNRIQEMINPAAEDISPAMRSALLAALNKQCRQNEELRTGRINGRPVEWFSNPQIMKLIRPAIENLVIQETIWSYSWTVAMDDDGKINIDVAEPFYGKGIDHESRVQILERMRKVDAGIGKIVKG